MDPTYDAIQLLNVHSVIFDWAKKALEIWTGKTSTCGLSRAKSNMFISAINTMSGEDVNERDVSDELSDELEFKSYIERAELKFVEAEVSLSNNTLGASKEEIIKNFVHATMYYFMSIVYDANDRRTAFDKHVAIKEIKKEADKNHPNVDLMLLPVKSSIVGQVSDVAYNKFHAAIDIYETVCNPPSHLYIDDNWINEVRDAAIEAKNLRSMMH